MVYHSHGGETRKHPLFMSSLLLSFLSPPVCIVSSQFPAFKPCCPPMPQPAVSDGSGCVYLGRRVRRVKPGPQCVLERRLPCIEESPWAPQRRDHVTRLGEKIACTETLFSLHRRNFVGRVTQCSPG